MVSDMKKNKCTGCGVCKAVCPADCISMQKDKEGFLYPLIDESKCINCGKCDRLCHAQHIFSSESEDPKVYIGYNKNEKERLLSSSGGAFIEFARHVTDSGGTVYGAAVDDSIQIRHMRADSADKLQRFQGSKYVQSVINSDIYTSVKNDLDSGRNVLYSGTPCQIGALNRFLGKTYPNLTTLSFICHGVPSPYVWQKYAAWQEAKNNSKIKTASFRSKDKGWVNFSMKLEFENGNTYSKINSDDPFLQVFLKNACLRPSCHACQYKGKAVLSNIDILLADKWGSVRGSLPNMTDDKGISMIFVQTEKGKTMFNKVSSGMYFAQTDYSEAINSNPAYSHCAAASKNRTRLFEEIDSKPFDVLYKKYAKTPFVKKLKSKAFNVSYKIAKKLGAVKLIKKILKRNA